MLSTHSLVTTPCAHWEVVSVHFLMQYYVTITVKSIGLMAEETKRTHN